MLQQLAEKVQRGDTASGGTDSSLPPFMLQQLAEKVQRGDTASGGDTSTGENPLNDFIDKWIIGDNNIAGDSIDWIGDQISKLGQGDRVLKKGFGGDSTQTDTPQPQPENAAPGDGPLPNQRRPPEPNQPQEPQQQPSNSRDLLEDFMRRTEKMDQWILDLADASNEDAELAFDQKVAQMYKDLMWAFQKSIADEPNENIKKMIMGRKEAAIEKMNLYHLQLDSKRSRDRETRIMNTVQRLHLSGKLDEARDLFGIDPLTGKNLLNEEGTPTGDYLTTALENPTYRHSRTEEIAASIAPLSDIFETSGAVNIVSTIIDGISEYSLGQPEGIGKSVDAAHAQIDDLVNQYILTPEQADLLHLQTSAWFEQYAQQEQERAQLFYLGAQQ